MQGQLIQAQRIRMLRKSGMQIAADDFGVENFNVPSLADGDVLTATRYFSLDPYLAMRMRTWQAPEPTISASWSQGLVAGYTLGEVIESRHPGFNAGDWIVGLGGWQTFAVHRGETIRRVRNDGLPVQLHLSALGSSGMTAWIGVTQVLKAQAGETAVVSSAAGIVGSLAGQILRAQGCRVIGIAGGVDKCAMVVDELGFDGCVDYRVPDFAAALARATDGAVDKYFENVGAAMLDAVLPIMRDHGRIALCGLIAHYQDDQPIALRHFRQLLMRAITLQGFRTADYEACFRQAHHELTAWLKAGKIVVKETITTGLENAPSAYIAMLQGGGSGKHLIKV